MDRFPTLVIDDEIKINEATQAAIVNNLRYQESDITFEGSRQEGLERLRSTPSIKVVFVDVLLPDTPESTIDAEIGKQLVEEIRSMRPDTWVFVFSAYNVYDKVKEVLTQSSQIVEYFPKPLDNDKVNEALDRISTQPGDGSESEPDNSSEGYSSNLDADTLAFLNDRADKVRTNYSKAVMEIVEAGKYIYEVRERLRDNYGDFGYWLHSEFRWSHTEAYRLINIYEYYKDYDLKQLMLNKSTLSLLASPSVSEDARQELIERSRQGENLTYSDAKEIKKKHQSLSDQTKSSQSKVASNFLLQEQQRSDQEFSSAASTSTSVTFNPPSTSNPTKLETVEAHSDVKEKATAISAPPISQVQIGRGEFWQLGDHHILFCGPPTSGVFSKRLPTENIDLLVAFPPSLDSWLKVIPPHVKEVFSCCANDFANEEFSELFFQFLATHTREQHFVVFAYLPVAEFFISASELDCKCYIADPNLDNCQAAIMAWQQTGGLIKKLDQK